MNFDFKRVRLNPLMAKERIIELRARITEQVFLHERLGKYIQRLVAGDAAVQPRHRLADPLAVRAGRARRRSRRLAARDHLLGPPREGLGAAPARADRGLPGRHPGARALHPQSPHLARAARGEPRPDDRGGDQGHRRRGFRFREERAIDEERRAARQPRRHHRNRAGHPQAHARGDDGRTPQPRAGLGLRLLGLRDWQAGDRFSAIDWAQSSLTNFSPLSSASSSSRARRRSSRSPTSRHRPAAASTACRSPRRSPAPIATHRHVGGVLPGSLSAWSPSTAASCIWRALRPRIGKSHVVHCLDAYQYRARAAAPSSAAGSISTLARRLRAPPGDAAGHLRLPVRRRRTRSCRNCRCLNGTHDVFLVLIDSAFAFDLPTFRPGGSKSSMSKPAARGPSRDGPIATSRSGRGEWQDDVRSSAKEPISTWSRSAWTRRKADIASASSSSNDACGKPRVYA